DELFSEKLDLLLKLIKDEKLSWVGKHRTSFENLGVYPRPYQKEIPVWIAAGGTPGSAARAGGLGLPLMLAIIGGMPEQFQPFVEFYKETWIKAGNDLSQLKMGINNHVYIAEDSKKAADEFYPYYASMMNRVGVERGWPPLTRPHYEQLRLPHGALMVGSADQVIDKILYEYELFHNTRFLAQASVGNVPHKMIMRSIELFGTKVAPVIRKAIAG
ncbi:MAG TPA: LLM class flavin-dependent oxidoreductase, partial [Puia sp.]|nr:LLM class flavin-dependent oxidoreductase [Puia sp.]